MVLIAPPLLAQPESPPARPDTLDARAPTEQYLASLPAAARARSDAYFEGGGWIRLWGFLITAGVTAMRWKEIQATARTPGSASATALPPPR